MHVTVVHLATASADNNHLRSLHAAMRLRSHVPLLQSTLKQHSTRQFVPSLCVRCRRYASTKAQPERIAVLGGGVSGLASAYFVSKEFPKAKITVYESGESAGGWLKSRRVEVPGGNVLFEYGPRTLRPGPSCLPTAQLVCIGTN
jgi:oxygen-dependent protoporphyrinogen oxidase